ncbi:VapE domain-containing protein [Plastorhodobacter daqingensis]|uniref:VapE domain-containing protein n=1 Tax=Plastorhodobacter daqingensis TaxID=1387281 RepID=A0ABW2UMP3_9RHOB
MENSTPTLQSVLDQCRELIDAGAALHWLVPGQKRPIDENWSTALRQTRDDLRRAYRSNANIGIRLGEPSATDAGYIHLIDLDIRVPAKAAEAHAALKRLWQDYNSAPAVISGSGGESRHFYFLSTVAFRKKKLAKSEGFSMVFDQRLGREVKKYDWEIDILGTGAQAVLPPSLHPDTGQPYRWERTIDFDMLALGCGPLLDAALIESWGTRESRVPEASSDDDDDLFHIVATSPVDLSDEEVDKTVADLPETWVEDRDSWVTVGAALHHQYGGGQIGFDKWCDWSKKSEKFDMKTQKSVWKSFKGDHRPVTMRSLIAAAQEKRLKDNLPALSEEGGCTELDELLGSSNVDTVAEKPQIDENWRNHLSMTEKGLIKKNLPNARLILANDRRLRGVLAFNEFMQQVVYVATPRRVKKEGSARVAQIEGPLWDVTNPVNGHIFTDTHEHSIRAVLESPVSQGGYDLEFSDRDIRAGVDLVAHDNSFHPVKNYLQSLTWDGKPRAERLFIDYLGCEDTPYHREAALLILLGAVARVMEPGHKFDFVPILEGLQGKKKSTFISVLGRNWFSELGGDFSDQRKMVEQIQGSWIIEIPELQGFSRADANELKAFLSRTVDRTRLAYDRRPKDYYRQCVFIGSTNDGEYLRDHTGGRRFWPIKCGLPDDVDIDTDRLLAELDMIWGEAHAAYIQMRKKCHLPNLPLFLRSAEAKKEATLLQESRRIETAEDALVGQIEAWLDEPVGPADGFDDLDTEAPQQVRNFTCTVQIWEEMMGRQLSALTHADATKIGKALSRVRGWEKFGSQQARTKKYGRQRVFVRMGVDRATLLDQKGNLK